MSDYEFDAFDDEPPRRASEAPAKGPELPGGVSLQTAAAILLVAVLLATLYLFFGPLPGDGEPAAERDAATATPRPIATAAMTPARSATRVATTAAGAAGREAGPTLPAATTGAPAPATTPGAPGATAGPAATLPAAAGLRTGGFARVTGTGSFGLRMRFGPGLDYLTIRFADESETLEVTGGPENGDGLQWWRVRDNQGNVGWVAAEYLVPVASPGSWSPPVASPTFPAGAASLEGGESESSGLGGAPVAAVTVVATTSP
jgi:hypothetical protein